MLNLCFRSGQNSVQLMTPHEKWGKVIEISLGSFWREESHGVAQMGLQ